MLIMIDMSILIFFTMNLCDEVISVHGDDREEKKGKEGRMDVSGWI